MKKLEELRFVLTDEMNKMFIEVLIIKQRLEEDITLKEQIALEKELKILTSKFIKEFRKNNVEQIKEYRKVMYQDVDKAMIMYVFGKMWEKFDNDKCRTFSAI